MYCPFAPSCIGGCLNDGVPTGFCCNDGSGDSCACNCIGTNHTGPHCEYPENSPPLDPCQRLDGVWSCGTNAITGKQQFCNIGWTNGANNSFEIYPHPGAGIPWFMAKGILAGGEAQIRFEVGYVWGPLKTGKLMGSRCSMLDMPEAVWKRQNSPTSLLAQ